MTDQRKTFDKNKASTTSSCGPKRTINRVRVLKDMVDSLKKLRERVAGESIEAALGKIVEAMKLTDGICSEETIAAFQKLCERLVDDKTRFKRNLLRKG